MPATPSKTLLDMFALTGYTERDELLEDRMSRYSDLVVF